MKRLRETTLYEYKGFTNPCKKKQWRERSLLDMGVKWKRTYAPLELLPDDVLRIIAASLPLKSRVQLQRGSVSLHKAMPGLFLPQILEPWRHVLPLNQHKHLYHFLWEVFYAGILEAPRRLLRVLNLLQCDEQKGTDVERFNYNRTGGTQTFCLALEFDGSERDKKTSAAYRRELIIASDSIAPTLRLQQGHAWRPDLNQWVRTTRHVWGRSPFSFDASLRWETRAFHTQFYNYSGADGWLLQEVLKECCFFDTKKQEEKWLDSDSDRESYEMDDAKAVKEIF